LRDRNQVFGKNLVSQQVRVADGALEERTSDEGDVHFALHELEVEPLVPGLADEGGAPEGPPPRTLLWYKPGPCSTRTQGDVSCLLDADDLLPFSDLQLPVPSWCRCCHGGSGEQEGAPVGVGLARAGEVLGVIEGEGVAVFGQVAQAGGGRTVAENGDRSILIMQSRFCR
jgi:hypothetical protein